eukprot:PhM_4_TR2179/c0_g1_i1/m.13458/K13247/CRYL1; L-gulonate 3-dehydrogenase
MSQIKIGIAGCGLVGRCWALIFLRAGHPVVMFDAAPAARDAVVDQLQRMLPALLSNGLAGTLKTPSDITQNVSVVSTLDSLVAQCGYLQECIPEQLELKRAFFKQLDAIVTSSSSSPLVFASSTSNLMCSTWSQDLSRSMRERCIVAHPINPPHCIPLVEVVPAAWTSPAVTSATMKLLRGVGQAPVLLKKEVPGFAVNRLQYALLAEAFMLVQEGVMDPNDVDKVLSQGLGLRWSFLGPFETIDLNAPNGVRQYEQFYGRGMRAVLEDMKKVQARNNFDWSFATIEKIDRAMRQQHGGVDKISERRDSRDKKLMAIAQNKQHTLSKL